MPKKRDWKSENQFFALFQVARKDFIVYLLFPYYILTSCKVLCTNLLHLGCNLFFSIFGEFLAGINRLSMAHESDATYRPPLSLSMTCRVWNSAKNRLNVVSYRYLHPLARYLSKTTIFWENFKNCQFSGGSCGWPCERISFSFAAYIANNLKNKQQKYELRIRFTFLSMAKKRPNNGQKWLFLAIFRNFVKNGL